MHPRFNFNDALQANFTFLVNQLTRLEPEINRIQYPELDYASLVPVDTSGNEWATTVTYFSLDGVGKAQWVNGNAGDIPNVDASMERFETSVYMAGIGARWGLEELEQARLLGLDLGTEKMSVARRAYEEFMYDLAFFGDTGKGFEGLFNNSNVTSGLVANDGTGPSTTWGSKTGDLISRDINAALIGIHSDTKTVGMADTVIIPVTSFQYIASTRIGDTNMTILDWVMRSNVYTAQTGRPLLIRANRKLETAGAGSTKRMVTYRRSPEVVKMHLPMPHRFLPVQIDKLQFEVPGIFRAGGTDIRRPKEVRYSDGI